MWKKALLIGSVCAFMLLMGTVVVTAASEGNEQTQVRAIDMLGAKTFTKAPSSFSSFWRGVGERLHLSFTFNALSDGEVRLRYAEERRHIILLLTDSQKEKDFNKARKQLNRMVTLANETQERYEDWFDVENVRAERLLEALLQHELLREDIFDALETRLPESDIASFYKLRTAAADRSGAFLRMLQADTRLPKEVRDQLAQLEDRAAKRAEETRALQDNRRALLQERAETKDRRTQQDIERELRDSRDSRNEDVRDRRDVRAEQERREAEARLRALEEQANQGDQEAQRALDALEDEIRALEARRRALQAEREREVQQRANAAAAELRRIEQEQVNAANEAERQALQDQRDALEAEQQALEDERQALEQERQRLEEELEADVEDLGINLGDDDVQVLPDNLSQFFDADSDGVLNADDNCSGVANADQADSDRDTVGDACDNCVDIGNTDQADENNNGVGDQCEAEDNPNQNPELGDPVEEEDDLPFVDLDLPNSNDEDENNDPNPFDINDDEEELLDALGDADSDGVTNGFDNCRNVANPDQKNIDGDSFGNACDTDDDGDGRIDILDNCPLIRNADQSDVDNDGDGDLCDTNGLNLDLNLNFPLLF